MSDLVDWPKEFRLGMERAKAHEAQEVIICDCGRPAHYIGHHYPDTSQPGLMVVWCECGGMGGFHHTSIEVGNNVDFGTVGRNA